MKLRPALVAAVLMCAVWCFPRPSEAAVDPRFPIETKGGGAIRERLRRDIAAVRAGLDQAAVPDLDRRHAAGRLDELVREVDALPDAVPPGFRTIMPFSDLQARVFALNAIALRARGYAALTVWTQNRWDPLLPLQAPSALPARPSLTVSLMRREVRSEAFCLTNATDAPLTIRLRVTGLPPSDDPRWVSVREVLFTDTYVHLPIAAALPEAQRAAGAYRITVPAGTTRQVWLTFHTARVPAGLHRGAVAIEGHGRMPIRIPLQVRVYPLDLPVDHGIALGGWDYTHQVPSARDAASVEQGAFIRFLRAYGVDTPWSGGIPLAGCAFDAEGNMTRPPDFSIWDRWVAKWPRARFYAHYVGFDQDFLGEPLGTPRFRRMVVAWIGRVVEHARSRGIRPGRLLLLLVDEPHTTDQERAAIAFAEAIRAAAPGVVIWNNPAHDDPAKAPPRLYELSNVLCPLATRFVGSPPAYRDLFLRYQRAGHDLWFYSCVNGKHLDPITYHRGQFWLAIRYGAKGSCYWSFGDEGGAGSSFRAYTSPGHMFSPLFLDPQMGIIDGKHMQAIREGAQDFAYFAMLRRRVEELDRHGVRAPALTRARRLLNAGPERVVREITVGRIGWDVPKDRSVMDAVRLNVLRTLAALRTR